MAFFAQNICHLSFLHIKPCHSASCAVKDASFIFHPTFTCETSVKNAQGIFHPINHWQSAQNAQKWQMKDKIMKNKTCKPFRGGYYLVVKGVRVVIARFTRWVVKVKCIDANIANSRRRGGPVCPPCILPLRFLLGRHTGLSSKKAIFAAFKNNCHAEFLFRS